MQTLKATVARTEASTEALALNIAIRKFAAEMGQSTIFLTSDKLKVTEGEDAWSIEATVEESAT